MTRHGRRTQGDSYEHLRQLSQAAKKAVKEGLKAGDNVQQIQQRIRTSVRSVAMDAS